MMKLVIEYHQHQHYLAWNDDDDGVGAYLGQSPTDGTGEEPSDLDEYEHWIASKMAREDSNSSVGSFGICWESETHAKKMRAAINARLRQPRALPDWAKKAIAAGWKAPKGWKP